MWELAIGENFLQLDASSSITIELVNPLFTQSHIPGPVSYPVKAPIMPINQKALGFPELTASTAKKKTFEDTRLWVANILWKKGYLTMLGWSEKDYSLTFKSDAGSIAEDIKAKKLADFDLGTEALSYGVTAGTYPTYNYALFPVKNPSFYGDQNPDFKGYLNYYHGGSFQTNSTTNDYAITPFPYMCHILQRIMDELGYQITGTWFTDPGIQSLCLYNNYALDKLNGNLNEFDTELDHRNHVPDITAAQFFLAVQNTFGVRFIFDTVKKTCKIITLKSPLTTTNKKDYSKKVEESKGGQPNTTNGFTLTMALDSADNLIEIKDIEWSEKRIENGEKELPTSASTLFMASEEDTINTGRNWLIPETDQAGSSPEFEQGTNRFSLRLLAYRGMQNDSLGNPYPLGSWDNKDYSGAVIPDQPYTLRWEGDYGLYKQWHEEWIHFLSTTEPYDRQIRLDITDLLSIDYEQQYTIDYINYLWKSIRVTIDRKRGIRPAKVQLLKI